MQRAGKIDFINAAGARLLGAKDARGLTGTPVADIMSEELHAVLAERAQMVMSGAGKLPMTEGRYVGLDGRLIDVEVETVPVTFKGMPAVQSVARDITERKAADEKLRDNELRYRTLFEGSRDAILSLQEKGALLTATSRS